MPLKIPALMEHADDVYSAPGRAEEYDMRTDGISSIASANVIARSCAERIVRYRFDRFLQSANVVLGLSAVV
jgi:hypothetical protein